VSTSRASLSENDAAGRVRQVRDQVEVELEQRRLLVRGGQPDDQRG